MLIIGFLFGKIFGNLIYNELEDKYIVEREIEFNKIVDTWNEKNKSKGVQFHVGRYGSYIVLEFKECLKTMGKFLMKMKKVNTLINMTVQEKKRKEAEIKEEDY